MANKIDKPIKNYLVDFGLTDKEITVYLTLLKTGPNTIMNLARETGIKRSTTHNTVEELIKKGLVSQTNYGERRMVVAEDPKKLEFLMEQKRWDMRKLEDNLPDIVKAIYDTVPQSKENTNVEVKYYNGESGVRTVYKEVLHAKEIRSYVNISRIFELFPENPTLFPANLKKGEVKMYEFIEDSEISRNYVKDLIGSNYDYKFLPKTWDMRVFDYMIFSDKIAIITSNELSEVSAILITNQNIADNARFLFDMTWDLTPEPK